MSEPRQSEISVDQLMQRIRAEVERRQATQSSSAAPVAAALPALAAAAAGGHTLGDVASPAPLALQLREPDELNVQPGFQAKANDRYHVDDLMLYHDQTFVFAAYQTLLHRAPDKDGLRHYLGDLRKGISRIEIVGNIRYSSEGRRVGVSIAGLAAPYALQKVCRFPVIGGPVRFAAAIWNLTQQQHRQRVIENQVIQLAEQTGIRTADFLRRVHGALRELERACNESIAYAATKSSHAALQAVQASKADQSGLEEARQLLRLAIDSKAERHELTTFTNHLVELVQARLAKEDIAPLEESLDAITESIALITRTKADRVDLDVARRDVTAASEAALNRIKQTVQSLSDTKADRAAIETAQAQAKSALNTALESFKRTIESLSESKVDRTELAAAQRGSAAAFDEALDRVKQTIQSLSDTKADRATIETAQAELYTALESVRKQAAEALKLVVDPLSTQTQRLKRDLLDQERRLGVLLKEARKRLPKPMAGKQIEAMLLEGNHLLDSMYANLEDQFRGTREDIRQRQEIYLPYVRDASVRSAKGPVIDLGCGRGEWLELLRDEGIAARGVDLNRVFLKACRQLKLNVTEQDAVEFLGSLKSKSAGAITAFHLIEHLPFDTLIALFDEALRVLRPGGIVIFETPNPRNMIVGSCTFYLDPTHRNPLPPELPRHLLEARGFENVTIKELHPFPKDSLVTDGAPKVNQILNQHFFGPQDYAVIATKG